MSAEQTHALRSRAPTSNGVANSTELRFTTAAGSLSNPLPLSWLGQYVEIMNESSTAAELIAFLIVYANDTQPAVTIAAAAADGGGATGRGKILLAAPAPGHKVRVRLPTQRGAGEVVNFIRIAGSGTPNVSVSLV